MNRHYAKSENDRISAYKKHIKNQGSNPSWHLNDGEYFHFFMETIEYIIVTGGFCKHLFSTCEIWCLKFK